MLDVNKIKEELNVIIQKISLQFGGMTKEEKRELLYVSEQLNHTLIALTIFDNDESIKDIEDEKDN